MLTKLYMICSSSSFLLSSPSELLLCFAPSTVEIQASLLVSKYNIFPPIWNILHWHFLLPGMLSPARLRISIWLSPNPVLRFYSNHNKAHPEQCLKCLFLPLTSILNPSHNLDSVRRDGVLLLTYERDACRHCLHKLL